MNLDEIYIQIGEFGPLQRLYFFSIAFFNFYPPFNMIQIVFTGEEPSFVCLAANGTRLSNTCPNDDFENCETILYTKSPDTFAKEWGLICNQRYKIYLIQSIFMAGVMVGALTFGPVADSWGRRRTMFLTTIGVVTSGIISSLMPSYVSYAIGRFSTGFFGAGSMISAFVLSSELVGASMRSMCGNLIQMFFAFGIIGYSVLGYFVQDWRHLSLISSCIGIMYLIPFLWLPESPRWLLTHNRIEEASVLLGRIARSNKRILETGAFATTSSNIMESSKVGMSHIFQSPKICVITIIQLFSWFVNSIVYYGLTLAAGDLGSDIYMSQALSGFVEIPAYIASIFLIDWIGRKKPLCGFMVFGGLSCLIFKWYANIGFPLFGKLAIAASFSIVYIQTAEIYPTVVRNSFIGLCSCAARVGGIVSPMTSFANTITSSGQFLLLGVLSVCAGLLNLWLPETKGKGMPETIQDLERLVSKYPEQRFEPIDSNDETEEEEVG